MWHVSYIYYSANSLGEKDLCWRGPTHMWLEPPCPCKGWQDKKTNLIWSNVITNGTVMYFGFALATLFQDLLCRLIFVVWSGRVLPNRGSHVLWEKIRRIQGNGTSFYCSRCRLFCKSRNQSTIRSGDVCLMYRLTSHSLAFKMLQRKSLVFCRAPDLIMWVREGDGDGDRERLVYQKGCIWKD